MQPSKDQPLSASMSRYEKGGVDIVDPTESVKRYVYSNVYEVGARAKPYEKIAVAKNGPYVVECIVAEGVMPQWRLQPHDEFVLCLEGEVRIDFIEPRVELPAGGHDQVSGEEMGYIIVREGSLCLLPKGMAYKFRADRRSLLLQQAKQSADTVFAWEEICEGWK
ncbi:MAG TPA: hydroxyquinol 1,2-dioxygenase [Methylomirabilota bacterium]|nr:hydroxyquinol 1,2-dioxygenase [Methylomirabilota bacterium]